MPTLANGGISRDGKTIVYHLRRGVKWQDGVSFTADDVIFSYQAVMNPNNAVQSRSGYDLITRIDKLDAATIVVHLKHAWAPFVATFFTMCTETYPVLPKHLLARYPNINRAPYNELPIGTGPFRVVAWEHGASIRFVANPNYWRGRPKLDEIDYNIIPNENTTFIRLQTHDDDLEWDASESLIAAYRKLPGMRVVLNPNNQYVFYEFNLANPILADPKVREALVLATNRAELISRITHGIDLAAASDQAPYLGWSDPALTVSAYDPARARAILDADGWKLMPDGRREKNGRRLGLTMVYTTGSVAGSLTTLLTQRWWHDIGVDVQVRNYLSPLLSGSYTAGGILMSGKFDVAFMRWNSGVDPDNTLLFRCDQFPPNGWNVAHFCDPRVEAAEDAALGSNDPATRRHAYREISDVLVHEYAFETLWFVRSVNVFNSDLRNFRPAHAVTEIWNPWELDI